MLEAGDFPGRLLRLAAEFRARRKPSWLAISPAAVIELGSDNPFGLGARRSFVPNLGSVTWELGPTEAVRTPLSARIFQLGNRRSVGYIRVPHYSIDDEAVEVVRSVIRHFSQSTDALVLDQVNNPGGSLFHAYALLSHLTDRVLDVPKHEMSIDDDEIAEAEEVLWLAEREELEDSDDWPTAEVIAYSRFILSEVEAGRRKATQPGYVFGMGAIQPSNDPYTKPLTVLINELTFSAPEYLAAIIQDNRRGTLFGSRTAGAGGLVKSFPGNLELGVEAIDLTWAMAWRTNGQPIESLGVHPDVHYSPTAVDLQGGFMGYREALLKVLDADKL